MAGSDARSLCRCRARPEFLDPGFRGWKQFIWRLAPATIENFPYREILELYDRSHTFFYLDLPYYGMKGYRLNFEPKDFEVLAEALAKVRGKFLMSLNDHPEVRRLFTGFKIRPVALKYSCMSAKGAGRAKSRCELLISNY